MFEHVVTGVAHLAMSLIPYESQRYHHILVYTETFQMPCGVFEVH